jgi:hypothetical protein
MSVCFSVILVFDAGKLDEENGFFAQGYEAKISCCGVD